MSSHESAFVFLAVAIATTEGSEASTGPNVMGRQQAPVTR